MRQSSERLEQRIARLEDQLLVTKAKPGLKETGEQPWAGRSDIPALTVVKLKPRADAPPSLDTATEIQEPLPDEITELGRKRAGDDDEEEAPPSRKDPETIDGQFEEALSGLKTGNFSGAVLKLQAFAEEHPRHARSDNALYFSGIGLLAMDDPGGAADAFGRVLAEYPAGDARMDSMLKLAECRVRLNQKDGARELYARIVDNFPGTTAATVARQRLSQLSP